MGKTAAERQREYRERHRETSERINIPLDPHAKFALTRLAKYHGISQRAMLERIIGRAERKTVETLDDPSTYYRDVTQ